MVAFQHQKRRGLTTHLQSEPPDHTQSAACTTHRAALWALWATRTRIRDERSYECWGAEALRFLSASVIGVGAAAAAAAAAAAGQLPWTSEAAAAARGDVSVESAVKAGLPGHSLAEGAGGVLAVRL